MPTGYTSGIERGITFEQFIMDCARAFDFCMLIRDEPGGGEAIPLVFEPDPYHFQSVKRLTRELEELQAMSYDDAHMAAAKEWEDNELYRKNMMDECTSLRISYNEMLLKVDEWVPPTPQHVKLKRFMRDQIELSMPADCVVEFYQQVTPRIEGSRWRTLRMKQKHEELVRHTKDYQRAVENAERSTAWVRALRESIGVQSTPTLSEGE